MQVASKPQQRRWHKSAIIVTRIIIIINKYIFLNIYGSAEDEIVETTDVEIDLWH